MGKAKSSVGYDDWDKIVKVKEESLKVLNINKKNLEVGEVIETLVLARAMYERDKFPKPKITKKEPEPNNSSDK